jgi:hypothetical protein
MQLGLLAPDFPDLRQSPDSLIFPMVFAFSSDGFTVAGQPEAQSTIAQNWLGTRFPETASSVSHLQQSGLSSEHHKRREVPAQ